MNMNLRVPFAIIPALVAVSLFAQIPQIDQARAAINRGDSDAAIDILEKAIVQSPQSAEAHFYLGKAHVDKGGKGSIFTAAGHVSTAMAEFEKAIVLNPRYVDARFALAEMYAGAPSMMGGSIDKAVEQAKAITPLDPTVAHRVYALIYAQQQKPDLAKKEYTDAIREQPNSPKAHSYFGQYLLNTEKNYAAAFTEFDAALKVDPHYMAAFYHLGRTAALGNTNLARGEDALKQYVVYTPKENEPTLANANYFLGAVYEKEGKKAEAKQSYEAALKLNPTLKDASEGLKRVSG
jgi:tetratricopeptide (TPR) repeat protein